MDTKILKTHPLYTPFKFHMNWFIGLDVGWNTIRLLRTSRWLPVVLEILPPTGDILRASLGL